jgi:glutamyl-tRNA synthetase
MSHTQPNPAKVVTRFAPSPTGFMHIGGVRTALFAYLWTRKNKGDFILRIEDTDKEREVEGSIKHIEESLRWIGIDWDYGPENPGAFGSCIQSERLDIYKKYAEEMLKSGLAYIDPYTKEEVEEFRKKSEEEKRPFLFRNYRPEAANNETREVEKEIDTDSWYGKKPLRFRVPEIKRYVWNDAVRGELSAGEEALDDFILIKSDGYPTYNFAHIIDDKEMNVTHIFRADEFISSTPKFLSLYDALKIEYPVFVTLPPILRDDRTKKLGKRDGAKDILEYREEGYLSEAMFNFLAFVGWNPGGEKEIFSKEELIDAFSLEHIQKGGAVFNEEKLDWMNREHIKSLPEEVRNKKILERLNKYGFGDISIRFYPIIFDRISKWGDIDEMVKNGELSYLKDMPEIDLEKLPGKNSDPEKALTHLTHIVEILENADEASLDSAEKVKNLIFDYATEKGRGEVLWPLRFSLSGLEKSPDPFTLISVLGKEESIARIKYAIEKLQKH